MNASLLHWADKIEGPRLWQDLRRSILSPYETSTLVERSLHPIAGEIIGHRLMRLLGIGTAQCVKIVDASEALRRDPLKWILKTIMGDRLEGQFFGHPVAKVVVLVEKIPSAIPIFYLRQFYGIGAEACPVSVPTYPGAQENLDTVERIRQRLWLGKDQVPKAREFYADFSPPADWSSVKRAIQWDSEAALAIHAARLYLCTSTAHSANILVDAEGCLYTIDFECCTQPPKDDLDKLFSNISPRTHAFESLRPISKLSKWEVDELFEGFPEWVEWPLDSKEATVGHYIERLRKWQQLFHEAEKRGAR